MSVPLSLRERYASIRVNNDDANTPVIGIRIVVHTTGLRVNTQASNNHVTQYLLLPNERSVQINMTHNEDDVNGTLEIRSRDYHQSRSMIVQFPPGPAPTTSNTRSPEVRGTFTVQQAIDAIYACGLQDFTFTGGGMGCRHWQIVLLGAYESYRWVAPGSALSLFGFASYEYSRRQAARPILIRQGTFDRQASQLRARATWTALEAEVTRRIEHYRGLQGANAQVAALVSQRHALQASAAAGEVLLRDRESE